MFELSNSTDTPDTNLCCISAPVLGGLDHIFKELGDLNRANAVMESFNKPYATGIFDLDKDCRYKALPKGIYNLLLKNKTINEHQKFVKE